MILKEQVKDLTVIGQDTSKQATISGNKLAKLQYLLTKGLYKDPITAVIAEWTNNGIDSVVQAGKDPKKHPVIVNIGVAEMGQHTFSVEDKGVGLDNNDFENICMSYLESTKENDNDTIGHFGIGMKSFLSLERPATFTCRKDGVERKYLVYEGAEFVKYDMLYEKETTEENGVKAEVKIDYRNGEFTIFGNKARLKLAYYETAVLIINGTVQATKILRNELFQIADPRPDSGMHISLKDVYYPIDWQAIGVAPINIPVAIRLSLSDGITPTPSRESYITNEATKKLILRKIGEIADFMINKYNEQVKEFPNLVAAIPFIGQQNHVVDISGNVFLIDVLRGSSKIPWGEPKIKGISLLSPVFYKIRVHDLLGEYTTRMYMGSDGVLRSKFKRLHVPSIWNQAMDEKTIVLVEGITRGNVKDYFRDTYPKGALFVERNLIRARTGLAKSGELLSYETMFGQNAPQKELDKYIKEWDFVVSTLSANFIDETQVETSKPYLDWLAKKQAAYKEKLRLAALQGIKIGLNKKEGDVTLAYSYERYGKVHFNKAAVPLKVAAKHRFLTVLIEADDNLEEAKQVIKAVNLGKNMIKFATVGVLERKKIEKHFQFINYKQFMTRDCKPFMRLASAIKFEEIIVKLNNIKSYKNGVFNGVFKDVKKYLPALEEYMSKNMTHASADAKGMILDAADAKDLYDKQLWNEYLEVKKVVEQYDFIYLFNIPSYPTEAYKAEYEKVMNQIILFRKQKGKIPQGTKVVIEKV